MGWIANRINAEYRKHGKHLDWALIAEAKILSQLNSPQTKPVKMVGENTTGANGEKQSAMRVKLQDESGVPGQPGTL